MFTCVCIAHNALHSIFSINGWRPDFLDFWWKKRGEGNFQRWWWGRGVGGGNVGGKYDTSYEFVILGYPSYDSTLANCLLKKCTVGIVCIGVSTPLTNTIPLSCQTQKILKFFILNPILSFKSN